MDAHQFPLALLDRFRQLNTCVVASAIEEFRVRLPNTGFANSSIQCIFKDLPPVVGYAATARIRTAIPPMEGYRYHYERTEWWNHVLSIPSPRVVVLEDLDNPPGLGAFVGEVNANIFRGLECAAVVTNGGVRDLPEVRSLDFPIFAGNVSVSHAYAHIFDFGGPVIVGGLEVQPGDLIHADRHGVQTIPLEIAERIPAAADEIRQWRKGIVTLCRSANFSVEKLRTAVNSLSERS